MKKTFASGPTKQSVEMLHGTPLAQRANRLTMSSVRRALARVASFHDLAKVELNEAAQ